MNEEKKDKYGKWKTIPGFEGYEVSNKGYVRSIDRVITDSRSIDRNLKSRILKFYDGNGYNKVILSVDNRKYYKYVHQLVAEVFLNYKKRKGYTIDHINGDKKDNNMYNLQILTLRENIIKYRRDNDKNKTSKYVGVSFVKKAKKYKSRIYFNKTEFNLGLYINEVEAYYKYQSALNLISNNNLTLENKVDMLLSIKQ